MNPNPAEHDAAAPADRPPPGLDYYARKALKALASLRLTVVLFALSIGLVFFGTLAQRDAGIWTVVDQYFWSWVVWIPFDLINQFGQVFAKEYFPKDGSPWGGSFPFPGGKLLGGAMLLNLLAAHLVRFKLSWRRSGVLLIHSGLILLFVGEFITREYAIEQRMTIKEGESVNYTEDARHVELAFVDRSDPNEDHVVVIPESILKRGTGRISHPDLPVDVEVVEFMANSSLEEPKPGQENPATRGFGLGRIAVKRPEVSGVDPNQSIDLPAAYVTLFNKGTDDSVGTYMVALRVSLLGGHDEVEVEGRTYEMAMRFQRYYKPYSLHLIDFRFDRYIGTEKAMNYSSQVILRDPEQGVEREVVIRMNEPLRHRGETFYQSNFDRETETTTILQVVKNPGWLIPYISCVVVTLGLLVHFGIYLTKFLSRRAAA